MPCVIFFFCRLANGKTITYQFPNATNVPLNYIISGHFICQDCGRSYKHMNSLKYHQRVMCNKDPTIKCQLCSYKTYRFDELRKHSIFKHSIVIERPKKNIV